ncbi:hypothetical protein M9Y10_012202 [Tritrichomonas musculus]|uniref:Phosphoprotein phosphatase n=1 Tax=Tritrichomonas musculus TaxID=1915356 RepID=A0ABR2IBV4_9EUKA
MKKVQPPSQSRPRGTNSPRSKTPLRVPPQSSSVSSASISSSSSAQISPYLQKLPSEQFFGQKVHKPRSGTSPKRILTPSNRAHQIKQPNQGNQITQANQPKPDATSTKASTRPKTASGSGQNNQNLNLNKLNPNINISSGKKQQQQQQQPSPPQKPQQKQQSQSQQSQQPPQQSQPIQKKKKQQQPNIQRPVPSSKSGNRNSNNRCRSPKFDPTANLPPTHSPEFHYIFEKKLEICSKPLLLQNYYYETQRMKKESKNSNTPNSNTNEDLDIGGNTKLVSLLEEIRLKTLNLTHILRLVNENSSKLKDEEQDMIIDMIMNNILRPLRYTNPNLIFAEVPQILPDPEWPHLDLIYLILSQMQANFPMLLTYDFCKALYPVFNSSDINERIELIHFFKEYINVHYEYRKEMMNDLTNLLSMHIELSDRPFVVWTILPIFKEICALSEQLNYNEYDKEIRTTIIPLLRDKYAFYFFPLINDLLSYYSDGRPRNAKFIVEYLLKYWPQTSTTKQSNYTTFLAEMLHKLNPDDLRQFLKPVFKIFASEIISSSPKLAESSLTVWLIPDLEHIIESFSAEATESILEIMVPSIMRSANDHWWDGIRDIAMLIMTKILAKHDINILKEVAVNSMRKSNDEMRSKYNGWNEIIQAAQQNDSEISNVADEKEKQIETLFGNGNKYTNSNRNNNDTTENDDNLLSDTQDSLSNCEKLSRNSSFIEEDYLLSRKNTTDSARSPPPTPPTDLNLMSASKLPSDDDEEVSGNKRNRNNSEEEELREVPPLIKNRKQMAHVVEA